ncbi:MAG: hypothetical protein HY313_04625 [Acidobacteria bacterium]|nr:hypothetical protein [Acidobacteriota bacterium]
MILPRPQCPLYHTPRGSGAFGHPELDVPLLLKDWEFDVPQRLDIQISLTRLRAGLDHGKLVYGEVVASGRRISVSQAVSWALPAPEEVVNGTLFHRGGSESAL